ncbi:DUF6607 family protein [Marinigracilibium pacificum]|uniref:Uncharacterized protein n=1 Tax=Marinigracilibium pacificum TaxID=2729599 RepID=A0A848J7B6_9BACT|nr:DUF6607 family protein [Marinigracilibium pacificum]NMM50390.1 hypothetical protein [Marinigracilibium pacificum]
MKNLFYSILFILPVLQSQAQNNIKQDREAILSMCGCYDVTFNFAETFAEDENYEFHDNYRAKALEYVFPVLSEDSKIVLQHLLIVGDTMIIKHWRQDWIYENVNLYTYDYDNLWQFEKLKSSNVKGQWTQKVFQVDDSPRYEGTASWVHVDGKHYWENTTSAPLPRREFSKRKDYNVMIRRNRQEITNEGWIHEQDNQKVIRDDAGDKLLAGEKGWNTYNRTEDNRCNVAKTWWEKNQFFWADVRTVWDELFGFNQSIKLNKKVDDQLLFSRLFSLQDELVGDNYDSEEARTLIRQTIQKYLVTNQKLVSNK